MSKKVALLAAAAASAITLLNAGGASAQAYGSASFGTYRECGGLTVCDGDQPGQQIIYSVTTGGVSSTANTSLTLSGQTVVNSLSQMVTLPNDPASSVNGTVSFGAYDLPVLKAMSSSGATDRMGINEFGYESYTNTGTTATPFDITGMLNIDSFSGTDGGVYAGGAVATAYVGVWDPSVITSLGSPDAQTLFDNLFAAPCGSTGVLASNYQVTNLVTGVTPASPSISGDTGSCSGSTSTSDPLMLAPGQTVLVVAGLQLLTNRGGDIDASHTFTTEFTPDAGVQVQNLVSGRELLGVPEPASWALMLSGFLGLGGALRRRRAALAAG